MIKDDKVYQITVDPENYPVRSIIVSFPEVTQWPPKLKPAYYNDQYYIVSEMCLLNWYRNGAVIDEAELRLAKTINPFLLKAKYNEKLYYVFSNEKDLPPWIKEE